VSVGSVVEGKLVGSDVSVGLIDGIKVVGLKEGVNEGSFVGLTVEGIIGEGDMEEGIWTARGLVVGLDVWEVTKQLQFITKSRISKER